MKKLTYLSIALFAFASLFASCKDGKTIYDADDNQSAKVEIASAEFIHESSATVIFTPSSNTIKYEYAIGQESDRAAFNDGTMARETKEGKESMEYTFTSLNVNTAYMVFARAYSVEDVPGPTTSLIVHTFNNEIIVNESFTGYESFSVGISAIPTYYAVEYKMVTSLDNAVVKAFESEADDPDKVTQESLFKEFHVTFFDLQESTKYYVLIRAKDRQGNWTKTFIYETTTKAKSEVPSIDVTFDYNEFWLTGVTFEPSDNAGAYFLWYVEQGALENYFLSMSMYAGNYFDYMKDQFGNINYNGNVYTDKASLPYVNDGMDLERGYEVHILLIDRDGNPSSTIRRQWNTPSFDEGAGTAKVGIEVTPTALGGKYTFTPNDATMGFFCETYTAELIDGNDEWNPGAKDDEWIINNLMNYVYSAPYIIGTQWQYRSTDFPEFWPCYWEDASGGDYESGTEFIVAVVPLNKNGVYGVGEVTKFRYTKL